MNKKSTNRLIAILNVISILAIVIFYFSKSYLGFYVMTRTGEKSESMFNSIILNDKGLYNSLNDSGLNILFLDYMPDIKLLNENGNYSEMNGFIGGAIARIDDNIIVFGDLNKIDTYSKIRKFIISKNLKIIEFETLDVIDYGGLIEI